MPANASEIALGALTERTFLKLWSYPNPFRAAGKELADFLVVFGNDVVVISDKVAGLSIPITSTGWERWYKRTVANSLRQLKGAIRMLDADAPPIFVDPRASQALPLVLPDRTKRKLHLVAVAHRERTSPGALSDAPAFVFDSKAKGANRVGIIGPLNIAQYPVHVVDGSTLDVLFDEVDTAADFIAYLNYRADVIRSDRKIRFAERDLLAAFALSRRLPEGASAIWQRLARRNKIEIEPRLWSAYKDLNVRQRTRKANRVSYVIDRLIEHFHEEYVAGRVTHSIRPSFSDHEAALRLIASESRFGRRIIAHELYDILQESDQRTFWATTLASHDLPGVRYVWLTYPARPPGISLEESEQILSHQLQKYVVVARSYFPADVVVGVAVPNPGAQMHSYMIVLLDGTKWGPEEKARASHLRSEEKIFEGLMPIQRFHAP